MHYLVVADDPALAVPVCQGLTALGHAVARIGIGADALAVCSIGGAGFDAVVVDWMPMEGGEPHAGGRALVARLHGAGAMPPVLALATAGALEQRIDALMAGADDAMTGPLSLRGLEARLGALVRRCRRWPLPSRALPDAAPAPRPPPAEPPPPVFAIGRLRLDAASRKLSFGAASIALNRRHTTLMALLIEHVDRVVTRDMLLQQVWGASGPPATNVVESNLSRLRGRLHVLNCDAIETRRGEGYQLRSDRCG